MQLPIVQAREKNPTKPFLCSHDGQILLEICVWLGHAPIVKPTAEFVTPVGAGVEESEGSGS